MFIFFPEKMDPGHVFGVDNGPSYPDDGPSQSSYSDSGTIFTDTVAFPSTKSDSVLETRSVQKVPNYADFFVVYTTPPGRSFTSETCLNCTCHVGLLFSGYASVRDTRTGTWFVDDFVNVVAEESRVNDLAGMVCEVR